MYTMISIKTRIFKIYLFLFIHLFLPVLGLHCREGFSLVVARGLLSSCGAQALGHAGFSSCGTWAQ